MATTIYDATIAIQGQIIPVVSFKFGYARETEAVHTNASADPVDITQGKRTHTGELTLLLQDALRIEAAAPVINGSKYVDNLTFDIQHVQNLGILGLSTKVYKACKITEFNVEAAEGDINMKVTLPVVFMRII